MNDNSSVSIPERLRIVGRENGHYRTANGGWMIHYPAGWAYGPPHSVPGTLCFWLDPLQEKAVEEQLCPICGDPTNGAILCPLCEAEEASAWADWRDEQAQRRMPL